MPSLRELQAQVLSELLAEHPHDAAALIRADGIAAESRLRIYQNNARAHFAEALRSTFPVIRRLVGEEYFRRTAWAFQRRHPSRSGDLNHAGGAFPDYLRAMHSRDDFQYMGDVARLEWLIQESLLAPEHGPLDLQALARVDSAAYDLLHFIPHPTLRLFASRYPALRIWEANIAESEPPALDLDGGAERLAIMRHDGRPRFHPLSLGEYAFLQSITGGNSVTVALECGGDADPDFDATLSLQRFVAANAIVDFNVHDTRL